MVDNLDAVPQKSNIRIKEQEGAFVVFNLETSGFHRITRDANEILEKIDGKTTIREIAQFFAEKRKLEFSEFKNQLAAFLGELELRKIIVITASADH